MKIIKTENNMDEEIESVEIVHDPTLIQSVVEDPDGKAEQNDAPTGEVDKPKNKPLTYLLFSPETRMGRILRPVLRWLALITGVFALGLLFGYIGLYKPAEAEKEMLQAQLVGTNAKLVITQKDLANLQPIYQKAVEELKTANLEIALVKSTRDIAKFRLALELRDGPAALTTLDQLDLDLKSLIPLAKERDGSLANLLQIRFDLIKAELTRDPQSVKPDLEMLEKLLNDFEKTL